VANTGAVKAEAISDGLFQFLGGTERDLLACCNVKCLACHGIAPGASLAFANLKCTETTDANTISLLQMVRHSLDHPGEQVVSQLFGYVLILSKLFEDTLQHNGRG